MHVFVCAMCACVYMYAWICMMCYSVYKCVHVFVRVHVFVCACVRVCACGYMYTCECVCVCVCNNVNERRLSRRQVYVPHQLRRSAQSQRWTCPHSDRSPLEWCHLGRRRWDNN